MKANNKNVEMLNKNRNPKKRNGWVLLLKFMMLLFVSFVVVAFTDSKGYFNPDKTNNHTERKWNAFYDFTEKKNVDVVLVGNSHLYTGINPEHLSNALGANCFILASPGTSIMDSYYCLKEALERTHPSVAIIETYGISNSVNRELSGQGLSDQFKSFFARKNFTQKLCSMPMLFDTDNYLAAWSNSIRNHEFIFRDTTQLRINCELAKEKPKKDKSLYLGRFVNFTTGIEDSLMSKYDKEGAPVDGSKHCINKENIRYVHKIIELCKEKGVTPVFVTLPMYYKHIKNYAFWHRQLADVIEPTECRWFDMQQLYDTLAFDRNCFENTWNANQHMTYYGSLIAAYKLANYLKSCKDIKLPDRTTEEKWVDIFYGSDGYFENHAPRSNDSTVALVGKDLKIKDYSIKNCFVKIDSTTECLYVQLKRTPQSDVVKDKKMILYLDVIYKDSRFVTPIDLWPRKEIHPVDHYLFQTNLISGVGVNKVVDMSFEK